MHHKTHVATVKFTFAVPAFPRFEIFSEENSLVNFSYEFFFQKKEMKMTHKLILDSIPSHVNHKLFPIRRTDLNKSRLKLDGDCSAKICEISRFYKDRQIWRWESEGRRAKKFTILHKSSSISSS